MGSVVEQPLHHVRLPKPGSAMKGRIPALPRMHIGAMGDQQVGGSGVTTDCRVEQYGNPVRTCGVSEARIGLKEAGDPIGAPEHCGRTNVIGSPIGQ